MDLRKKIEKIRDNPHYRFTYNPTMFTSKTVQRILSILTLAYKALTTKNIPKAERDELLDRMVLVIAEFKVFKERSKSKYVHLRKKPIK